VTANSVLHVGAHACEEAAVYNELGCSVIWVESDPFWCSRIAAMGHSVIQATIWSESIEMTFRQTNNGGMSSSLLPLGTHAKRYPGIVVSSSRKVHTCTVDDLGLLPDFINMDIQGAEYEALQGAENTLRDTKWLYLEVSMEELCQGLTSEPELTKWLASIGFIKLAQKNCEDGSWGDALYGRVGRKSLDDRIEERSVKDVMP